MVLIKILGRKDAASLIVAIAAGLAVGQFALGLADRVISWLLDTGPSMDFVNHILQPIFVLILTLVILEGLVRLVVAARANMSSRV